MQRLTDAEKQEILRFIEADKPLPDKYRFLLFDDKREVELVWNGKTNEVCNVVLPFQTIEQVDEPRKEAGEEDVLDLFDQRGRQIQGWANKLIWGDNKLILSSLKNGPLRDEIEAQGGLKLIYIDPPFDVGADFSMDIEIGDDIFTKRPNILEEIAYRDTWGRGADSFISMIYERLVLMRDLLADDGSIFVHCDYRMNSAIRLALDEVFGADRVVNEIIWWYKRWSATSRTFQRMHDTIWFYSKSLRYKFNQLYQSLAASTAAVHGDTRRINVFDATGKLVTIRTDQPSKGVQLHDVWELPFVVAHSQEQVGYPTQKPIELLGRIIDSATDPGDLVADFFCGSGSFLAAAEGIRCRKIGNRTEYFGTSGRKWIGCDLGKFAIHTTRKRMIGVQRQLKAEGKDYRAFEILNLGKYERQHYIGVNPNLREVEKRRQLQEKEAEFVELILRAYRAEHTEGFTTFHGKKGGRLVSVGPVNLTVSRDYIEEIISECQANHITKVDLLGFEFEMGLSPHMVEEARAKGIDLALKYIPAEVFDKRAVEKNQVVFHDVAAIEVRPHVKSGAVAMELTDFSVFYSQDSVRQAEETIKNKGSKIVVEKGQIVKVSKDAKGVVTREVLTKKWTDWIDYWAIDFDYESKKEIIRVPREWDPHDQTHLPGIGPDQPMLSGWKVVWTGDYVFENEWQSFRTRKDRSIELKSPFHECKPGRRKIAVKVVDIFGNDTMTIIDVNVPGAKGKK